MNHTVAAPRYTLWQMVPYVLRLGAPGFGGPAALVGNMQRDLVDARRWISQEDYKEGLAVAQMAPARWLPSSPSTWSSCTTACRARPWPAWPL